MKVDIIGGGIAGLSSAAELKRIDENINVVVHEKNSEIGYNHEARKCGEGYSYLDEYNAEKPTGKSVFCKIDKIELRIGDKMLYPPAYKIYALDKSEFIRQIGKKAEKAGAEIITNDKIKYLNELDGDYIIDASGCPSFVKTKLGFKKGIKSVGYQQTIENSNIYSKNIKLELNRGVGYYWVFPRDPKKKEVNVGVGLLLSEKNNLLKMLEKFKKDNNIKGDINYSAGGLIPIGLQRPFRYKNILFVGDAGAGTYPIWAEGNFRANISGKTAAYCIANNCPNKYSKIIYQHYIKWDIIGKLYLNSCKVLANVGPNALNRLLLAFFGDKYSKILFD